MPVLPDEARSREARLAAAATGLGLAALALPAALQAAAGSDGPALCPFRLATGLPCPFCGGTRALAAAARGDVDAALRLNAVWPIVALVLVASGGAGLVAVRGGRTPLTAALRALRTGAARHPRTAVALLLVAVAIPWTVALAHRDAITSPREAPRTEARTWTPPRWMP